MTQCLSSQDTHVWDAPHHDDATYLSINQHHVSITQLTTHRDWWATFFEMGQQPRRDSFSSIGIHLGKIHTSPIGKLHPTGTRIVIRPSHHQSTHFLGVEICHWSWVRQGFCKVQWNTNLVCSNVWVWRNHGSASKVNAFAHHVST